MTRLSAYLLPTEKQAPGDAEALSHKLLVRAGLIRQVGSGLWSWLPAGWRTHEKIVQIVREEMNAIGGQELLMPVLNPAELWRRSGRYGIDEVFKLQDRRGADMVLAMTHEEVVTFHVSQIVRSYRQLPFSLYHFQTKERDEPRPRAGVLRTREFIMKDAYTFDRDRDGLDAHYERYRGAYDRVFDRVGLEWYRVESDVGAMGGLGAHEYMAPSAAGENDVALAPGFAANVEVASALAQPVALPAPARRARAGRDAGHDDDRRRRRASRPARGGAAQGLPDRGRRASCGWSCCAATTGSTRSSSGTRWGATSAPPTRRRSSGSAPQASSDRSARTSPSCSTAARRPAPTSPAPTGPISHVRGVEPGRDFAFEAVDVRTVEAGDTVDGHPIRIEPAIEVGNIFKLGTRYSEPFSATYLDESGREQLIWMGSYGIGPARIAAAAVEQFADEQGIAWPRAIAPFDAELVGLGKPGSDEHELAERLYGELREAGLDVIYDDRDEAPGAKFADAELLGVPLRLTVGRRTLSAGELEVQVRRGREQRSVPLEDAATAAADLWRSLP